MEYPEFESSTLELKEAIPTKDQILKAVVAFCNLHGGRIVLGVDDSRRIVGMDEIEVEKLMEYLDKSIYECCSPPIIPDIYTQRIGGKLVLIVRVSMGMQKPYFLKSQGLSKGVYIRLGRSTVRADAATIEELNRQSRRVAYASLAVYNTGIEDIDRDAFSAFLKRKSGGGGQSASPAVLKSYHLAVEDQSRLFPTIGGLLLFNSNPQQWFPEAFIICTVFSGHGDRQVVATRDAMGCLFDQFENAFDFTVSFLNKSFFVEGKRRREEYEIPPEALREVILNAIVHRNYAVPGPIKIAIYPDQIEVFSPGIFPGPIDVSNLTTGVTYIRNTAIAKVFREAGYVEKLGTGFITMFRTYAAMGLKPPKVVEGENFVKCILPREKAERLGIGADDESERILRLFLGTDTITIGDVVRELGLPKATAGRRLRELERIGRIHRKGKGPATRYLKRS